MRIATSGNSSRFKREQKKMKTYQAVRYIKGLTGALCLAALPLASHAAIFTINYSNAGAFSGTAPNSPGLDTVYAKAIFEDTGTNEVTLTMSVLNNIAKDAYVNDWYFNVSNINFNKLSETFISGVSATSVLDGADKYKADGTGGLFDVYFGFNTSNPGMLGKGTSSIYKFVSTGGALSTANFNAYSTPDASGGGNYAGAVHVQGYGNSVWLAGNPPPPVNVPEPLPLTLLGIGMLGIALSRRNKSGAA
jgi:hypothetical protein